MIEHQRHLWTRSFLARASSRRRGSTLLIVLAVLSVMVLLVATLAYTTKLDVISSYNFGTVIQRNESAQGSIAASARYAMNEIGPGPLGPLDLYLDPATGVIVKRKAQSNKGEFNNFFQGNFEETANVKISDLSARVNMNAADEEMLEELFRLVSNEAGISVDESALASAIISYRLGDDNAPGNAGVDDNLSADLSLKTVEENGPLLSSSYYSSLTPKAPVTNCLLELVKDQYILDALRTGIDESSEFVSDIRFPSFGDDQRFRSLADLMDISGMTPEFLVALAPYITVFSTSQQVRLTGDANTPYETFLDVNRASAEEIYNLLVDEYGGSKDDMLFRQFAVNVVDARDEDDVPTWMEDSIGLGVVIGLEKTPVLTEVYADSRSEDDRGDDGQFVEIYNPWSEPLSVDGWQVRVGFGPMVNLTGSIQADGYLILTDDYDNIGDPNSVDDPPGQGSFYDIFHLTANGGTRKILVDIAFDVPHYPGRHEVEMFDETGDLVDAFYYVIPTGGVSSIQSFQRSHPSVRQVSLDSADPYHFRGPVAPNQTMEDLFAANPRNTPFSSPLQLFEVFAGYAQADGSAGKLWGFPIVASLASQNAGSLADANSTSLLDARIIDLLTVEISDRDAFGKKKSRRNKGLDLWTQVAVSQSELEGRSSSVSQAMQDAQAASWAWHIAPPIGLRQGRINVNTASQMVLESMGFSEGQAELILERRADLQADVLAGNPGNDIVYDRLSDILADDEIWSGITNGCDRLNRFRPMFDRLSLGSRAFLLEGTPRETAISTDGVREQPRAYALIALDREAPDFVAWKFVH
jgi:hypothetical protein